MEKETGICCAGSFCNFPHMQLWKSGHNCSVCRGIVHLNGVCSTASLDANGDDVFVCASCSFRLNSSTSPPTEPKIADTTTPSPVKCATMPPPISVKKVMKCPHCGGDDHQRSSSKLCKKSTYSSRKSRGGKEKNSSTVNAKSNSVNVSTSESEALQALLSIGSNEGSISSLSSGSAVQSTYAY